MLPVSAVTHFGHHLILGVRSPTATLLIQAGAGRPIFAWTLTGSMDSLNQHQIRGQLG